MNDLTNVLIRGLVAFTVLLLLARLVLGKKHISQITYFEYIVGITIGSIAGELTFSPHIRMSNFLLGLLIWSIVPFILSKTELISYRFRVLTEGSPTNLIKDGKILEKNLKKENITADELMIHLRQKNIFDVSDVESAIMETSGQVSVMIKSDLQPLTPKDMGLVVDPQYQSRQVIIDGNVMERSLNDYGYTKDWLLTEVKKHGAHDFHDVFLAQIDSKGDIFVDLYNDSLKFPQIKEKLLTSANIKQLQANLQNFALQTENPEAKNMYQSYAEKMDKLQSNLSVYLKE